MSEFTDRIVLTTSPPELLLSEHVTVRIADSGVKRIKQYVPDLVIIECIPSGADVRFSVVPRVQVTKCDPRQRRMFVVRREGVRRALAEEASQEDFCGLLGYISYAIAPEVKIVALETIPWRKRNCVALYDPTTPDNRKIYLCPKYLVRAEMSYLFAGVSVLMSTRI